MANVEVNEVRILDPTNYEYFHALGDPDFQPFMRKYDLLVVKPDAVDKGLEALHTQKMHPQSHQLTTRLLEEDNRDRFVPVPEVMEDVLKIRYTFLNALSPYPHTTKLLEEVFRRSNANLESIIRVARKAGVPIYHHHFGVSVGCEEMRVSPIQVIFLHKLYKGQRKYPRELYGLLATDKSDVAVGNYVGFYVYQMNKIFRANSNGLTIKGKYGQGYRLFDLESEQ